MSPAPAGFFRRAAAFAIDLTVLFAADVILSLLVVLVAPATPATRIILVWPALAWAYFSLMESSAAQATVGKLAMGVKVVDRDGAPISFRRASIRQSLKVLSTLILLLGWFIAAIPPGKRALHDLLGGTVVVRNLPVPARIQHWDRAVLGLHEYWDGQQWVRTPR